MARAWSLVVSGEISEAEFHTISMSQILARFKDQIVPRKSRKSAGSAGATGARMDPEAPAPPRFSADSLDEAPKTASHLLDSLEAAQQWLIEARNCLDADTPRHWNDLITQALTPIGKLRFEASERQEDLAE